MNKGPRTQKQEVCVLNQVKGIDNEYLGNDLDLEVTVYQNPKLSGWQANIGAVIFRTETAGPRVWGNVLQDYESLPIAIGTEAQKEGVQRQ
jgi:hypothetical protein